MAYTRFTWFIFRLLGTLLIHKPPITQENHQSMWSASFDFSPPRSRPFAMRWPLSPTLSVPTPLGGIGCTVVQLVL